MSSKFDLDKVLLSVACLSPLISLVSSPVYFSIDKQVVEKPLPYIATSRCANYSSNPICVFSTNNPSVSALASSLSFLPTAALGTFDANVTCSQNGTSSSLRFSYDIVYADDFKFTPLSSNSKTVPDCMDSLVTTDTINYVVNGGVTNNMITISNTPASTGDFLFLPQSSLENPYSLQFSFENVVQNQIYIRPSILSNVLSSRETSTRIRGIDPSGNNLDTDLKFIVKYTYCPYLSTPNATLSTNSSLNHIPITSSVINVNEPHGLNAWEIEWQVNSVPNGRLEYYCPDKLCSDTWQPIAIPGTIKQVFFKS